MATRARLEQVVGVIAKAGFQQLCEGETLDIIFKKLDADSIQVIREGLHRVFQAQYGRDLKIDSMMRGARGELRLTLVMKKEDA